MTNCNFCHKKGLLIYLVRYAVASPYGADGVPGLSGNFRIEDAPQAAGAAKYTLRALRPGYLYTYDERRQRLKAYIVLPSGHLWNYPLEYNAPHPSTILPTCTEVGEVVRAYCVDIEHTDADPAGNFWIGWSNVQWTRTLIKKVSDASWRKKHMRCIAIPALLAGSAVHTGEFSACAEKVSHFAANPEAMKKAFSFSNTSVEFESRKYATKARFSAIMAQQEPHFKGYIAALNDPVGMTNDFSELTVPGVQAGFDEKVHQSKVIADILTMTEQHVRREARDDVNLDDTINEVSKHHPDGNLYTGLKGWMAVFKAGGLERYEKKQQEKRRKYGIDKAARQEAAADEAWHDLTHDNGKPTLDEKKLKAFPAVYEAALKEFEPRYLQLVMTHVGWLRSEQLANWMEAVHDDADIRSGYAYNESVSQCIGHAVCTQPCIDQLTSWISDGDLKSPRNLYGRSLLYNQADIIAATEPHLKGSDLQFENVLNIYKGALARLQDPMQKEQLIDRLALTTANVIGKSLSETSHNVLAKAYLYLLADGKVRVEKMTRFDLAKWAIAQAKEQGVKLDSQRQQTRADARTEARRAVNYAKANPSIDIYELDIAKLEREGRIAPGSIKGIGIPGVAVARRWLGSSSPPEFRLGIVTILIQLAALNFAMKDLANNDQFNEEETTVKATVAILSLGATIVETVAVTVEKSVEHPLAAFIRRQWSMDVERVKRLALQARLVGALAGIGAASYDIFINTPKAYREGNKVLAGLYFSNGVLAARIAAAGFFSLGTLFWPLLLLSIGIGIAIALVNNSQLKTWLSRCEFSVGEKYVSFNAQLKGYHDAMGA